MKIRVQIVVYRNEVSEIHKNLQALSDSKLPKDVQLSIFIGDNSCDLDYQSMLKRVIDNFSSTLEIEYVANDKNVGHGQAHNELFFRRSSAFDFLLIMNPDGCISPTTIVSMVESMNRDSVGAVEARQLPIEHPKVFDWHTGETSWVSGACVLVRASVFRQLGGFDRRFFLHGDDVDLSWRIRDLGFTLHLDPKAIFFHRKLMELNGFPKQSESEQFYGPLGALLIAHKYRLRTGLNLMVNDLKTSPNPLHKRVLSEFESVTRQLAPITIQEGIAQYIHPWKFSKTRY